ncbi:MAG TPA: PLP-dependent aminotransferase family protein [Pyrinomonadaceae bacterium]|jgi:GntR family transcriptional regulator/MocR family aminotransferase
MPNSPFIMLDDENPDAPLYRQIYEAVRRSVLSGEFGPRMRLPATRQLAKQLGVSRMTVVNAYEQLLAEGYVEGRIGAGTFVASTLPEAMLQVEQRSPAGSTGSSKPGNHSLSQRGQWLASVSVLSLRVQADGYNFAFQNGMPAIDEFPFKIWSQLASRRLRNPHRELLKYGDPAGYLPLREGIAAHLKSARGVRCDVDQVIVVAGSQQALDITARVLLDPNDTAWVEDPGYPGALNALLSAGAKIVPVLIDKEGFDLASGLRQSKLARLAYVTPSHQFPLGITMSLARRLSMLEWAKRSGAFIVEDDYNSEFRYSGRPLSSLQGLDTDGRVIYIGTFSKTIFPSLRLGCIVVPKDLVKVFIAARALIDRHSPSLDQAVLADFINEGHFARHIRRMRSLYEERQKVFVAAAKRELKGLLEVKEAEAGMHLVGWLPEGVSDKGASEEAARYGVEAAPLSAYSSHSLHRGGLVLGYTALNSRQIREGVRRLAQALA